MSLNDVILQEVKQLDSDLREVYGEYGSDSLYLKKLGSVEVDDVYDEPIGATYTEYKMMGRVTVTTDPEQLTDVGAKDNINKFTVRVIKSVVDEYGVETITTDDKMMYLGNELEILSVGKENIMGDYFLQYKLLCRSKSNEGFLDIGK